MSRRPQLAARIAGLTALVALLALPAPAGAEPSLPAGFQDEVVFDGLEQPTNFRFAPDGRVFVAEKPGRILVFDDLADTSPTVFADLRGDVYDNGDRGLLGLELDPGFVTGRPYVYALYTWDHKLGTSWDPTDPAYGKQGVSGDPDCPKQNSSNSCLVSGRLVRLEEDPGNPDHVVEEDGLPKEQELLQGWCQQFSSHSIGELKFGPEGALYVSGGDGAAYESIPDWGQLGNEEPNPCGDPPSPAGTTPAPMGESLGGALRSQNLDLLNGAILRIDPDTGAAFPGNPLSASSSETTRRTVAKGFRNPFRFTFDQDTGEIYSGNVGSSEIEEIDRFPAPPTTLYNSGWPCYEGIQRHFQFKTLGFDVCEALYAADPSSTSLPLFSYSHRQTVVPGDECLTKSGSAVSGVSFYEGDQFPAKYKGALFFGDAVRSCFWVMYPGEDGKPDPVKTERFLREDSVYPGVEIAEGPGGYLYYADLFGGSGVDGSIHRIAFRPNSPVAKLKASLVFGLYDGSDKFETELDAGESSDPDGKALTYAWDLDEDGEFESVGGGTRTLIFTKAEQLVRESKGKSPNRVIAVKVEDDEAFTSVARLTVYPGDKPPTVTITSPSPSFRWGVGDEVDLDASAVDAQGNPINEPLPYYWATRMAHCPNLADPDACHVHPLRTFSGIKHAVLVAPQHEYPSYIDIVLRVSDNRGLSGTAQMRIDPRTVDLLLRSRPPGIELLAGSESRHTPFSTPAIFGSEILISAPETAVVDGATYTFDSWSDGGDRAHPIVVSLLGSLLRATYTTPGEEGPSGEEPDGGGGDSGGGGGSQGGGDGQNGTAKPPQSALGKHPPASTRSTLARFTFISVRGAGFSCKLDGKPKTPCHSPKTYKKLKPGRHTFRVWATFGVMTDLTPAKFSWKVLPPKR